MDTKISLLTQAVQDMLTATSDDPKYHRKRQLLYTVLTEVHGAAFAYDLAVRNGDEATFPNTTERIGYIKELHERYDDEYHL